MRLFRFVRPPRTATALPIDAAGKRIRVALELTPFQKRPYIELNLAGMTLTRLSTDTGGGNVEVVLPDNIGDLSVTAKSGAGNVIVHLPSGVAAKIHATTGMGKVIVDSPFSKIDDHTYQSPDYDSAAQKVEITAKSGAGNVSVFIK